MTGEIAGNDLVTAVARFNFQRHLDTGRCAPHLGILTSEFGNPRRKTVDMRLRRARAACRHRRKSHHLRRPGLAGGAGQVAGALPLG